MIYLNFKGPKMLLKLFSCSFLCMNVSESLEILDTLFVEDFVQIVSVYILFPFPSDFSI